MDGLIFFFFFLVMKRDLCDLLSEGNVSHKNGITVGKNWGGTDPE